MGAAPGTPCPVPSRSTQFGTMTEGAGAKSWRRVLMSGAFAIHAQVTVSHEAPENPTAQLGSAGFLRLLARLRLAAAAAAPSHGAAAGKRSHHLQNPFRPNIKMAAISTISFGRAGKHEGRGSGLLSYRSAPARRGCRRSLALPVAPKGNGPLRAVPVFRSKDQSHGMTAIKSSSS